MDEDLESILSRMLPNERAVVEKHIYTDALTMVGNRRKFDETLPKEYAQAKHTGYDLCLIIIDIDKFKVYNDTYGHPEGDVALRKTALTIQRHTKEYDLTFKIGGEELAVICPDVTPQEGLKIAERIREAVQKHTPVTISLGVASASQTENYADLYSYADRAVYRSKALGRNQVSYYEKV